MAEGKGGIYTCTDRYGKRITSDRPIAACIDREQRQLGSNGTLRRISPPSYTGEERAALAQRQRAEQAAREHEALQTRERTALLQRYPTPASHLAARKRAGDEIATLIADAQRRLNGMRQERVQLDQEMAFYRRQPDRAPASLRARIQANTDSQQMVLRYMAQQQQVLANTNRRFDEEHARLIPYWKLAGRL